MKLNPQEKVAHSNQYTRSKKNSLVTEWERETGKKWPTYEELNKKTGKIEPKQCQLHHIIPQQQGGPHKWWNAHPLLPTQHQGGIHGKGAPLNKILKNQND